MKLENTWYLWLATLMLLYALGDHPYSYYQILRWVVSLAAAYSAYLAYENKDSGWSLIFVAVAILFNPISPITMQRETWQAFDLIAALVFGARAVKSK